MRIPQIEHCPTMDRMTISYSICLKWRIEALFKPCTPTITTWQASSLSLCEA